MKRVLSGIYERILNLCSIGFSIVCRFYFRQKRLKNAFEQAINNAKLYSLRLSLKSCGIGLSVQFPVTITDPNKVKVGDMVSMAAYVHIWGGGEVTIGNRVMIGTHTSITSLTHDYQKEIMFDTLICKPVIIEDDVWVGSNCVILPGIKIGKGAVLGAGSVITKDVYSNTIVAGIPAQVLKERK